MCDIAKLHNCSHLTCDRPGTHPMRLLFTREVVMVCEVCKELYRKMDVEEHLRREARSE